MPKNRRKIGVFDSIQSYTYTLCKNMIIRMVSEKNGNFFGKNRQKFRKIVIITSTPEMNAASKTLGHVLWTCKRGKSVNVRFFSVGFL
jgi:hypothetical protein